MNPIVDAFELLIVAMLMVFIVLVGLMFMMEGFKKFATNDEAPAKDTPAPARTTPVAPSAVDATDEEYQRVAALVALAVASEEMSDRHFVVEAIERLS